MPFYIRTWASEFQGALGPVLRGYWGMTDLLMLSKRFLLSTLSWGQSNRAEVHTIRQERFYVEWQENRLLISHKKQKTTETRFLNLTHSHSLIHQPSSQQNFPEHRPVLQKSQRLTRTFGRLYFKGRGKTYSLSHNARNAPAAEDIHKNLSTIVSISLLADEKTPRYGEIK